MAKVYAIVTIFALILAVTQAVPARQRSRTRFLARQEAAPAPTSAPAPYPPAGVTPEVPFELPTETEAPAGEPDLTYGPPDDTYGPPDNTYGPPDATDNVEPQPDNTYGPPDAEDAALPDNTYGPPTEATDIDGTVDVVTDAPLNDPVSQNLIQPRNNRLRARPVLQRQRSAPLTQARLVEIIRSKPVLIYTLE